MRIWTKLLALAALAASCWPAAAAETIQQIYGLSETALRANLVSLTFDKILATVPDDYLRHESIELRAARTYLNGMKGIIAASATTVLTGERSFRRTVKEAKDYADGCRSARALRRRPDE